MCVINHCVVNYYKFDTTPRQRSAHVGLPQCLICVVNNTRIAGEFRAEMCMGMGSLGSHGILMGMGIRSAMGWEWE